MSKIHIQFQSEGMTVQKVMERLKNPRWNFFNLRNYLSLFTGEEIRKVEHVFHCTVDETEKDMDMLLVWAMSDQGAYHVYCIRVEETITIEKSA